MSAVLEVHHIVQSLDPGGLENGVVNVVNGLDPAAFRSTIWCLKHKGEFARRITAPGVAIHELGWRGGNDWRLALRLGRSLAAAGAHVVHTRNAEAFYYGFAAARLVRRMALVHSEHGRTFDDRPIRWHVQRLMSRHTDAIFAVSNQLRLDLERYVGIPAARIEVIPNGVPDEKFAVPGKAAARTELGLDTAAFVVGTVGRLVAVKNYPLLLRAAAQALGPADRLVFVGDGPERAALESLAGELGMRERTIFTGHSARVTALLPALDVFVLPSFSEGMSNTILEAMAAGLPVLASDVGGNRETFREGQDGCFFASGDAAALARHLEELKQDRPRRERMGASARQHAQAEFSMARMISRYSALYQTVAAPRGRRASPT